MQIAVVSKKGGVGKTTISLLLRECFEQADHKAAVQDWDLQGSASKALSEKPDALATVGIAYDVLIYDTPPNLDHAATNSAISNADAVLIVSTSSPLDMWETESTVEHVSAQNPRALVKIIVNRYKERTRVGRLLSDQLSEQEVAALSTRIGDRECYKQAAVLGWSALNREARDEIVALATQVIELAPQH